MDDGTAANQVDDESDEMNVRESGLVPAIVVGVILSGVNIWLDRNETRSDAASSALSDNATALATLTERVNNIGTQVTKLTELPYVRRDEHAKLETRVESLERRVDQGQPRSRP